MKTSYTLRGFYSALTALACLCFASLMPMTASASSSGYSLRGAHVFTASATDPDAAVQPTAGELVCFYVSQEPLPTMEVSLRDDTRPGFDYPAEVALNRRAAFEAPLYRRTHSLYVDPRISDGRNGASKR